MKKQYDIDDFSFLILWFERFDWDKHKDAHVDLTIHKQIARKLAREGILKFTGYEGTYEKYEINL